MGFSGPLINLSSEFNLVDTLFLGLFAGFFWHASRTRYVYTKLLFVLVCGHH